MQLGTRWTYGSPDRPANLPEVVGFAIDAVEQDEGLAKGATADWRWTLTWLEGKPVVELDDGTTIRFNDTDDSASITLPAEASEDDEDYDW